MGNKQSRKKNSHSICCDLGEKLKCIPRVQQNEKLFLLGDQISNPGSIGIYSGPDAPKKAIYP